LEVTPSRHEVKLVESTLPPGASVLVRIPSIVADDDHRYVLLSDMGASWSFDRTEDTSLRAWVLGAGGSGAATLAISDR
jgi:hypothetical protein